MYGHYSFAKVAQAAAEDPVQRMAMKKFSKYVSSV